MKLLKHLLYLSTTFAITTMFAQSGINQASYSGSNENQLTIKYVYDYTCATSSSQTSYTNNSTYHTGKNSYDSWDSQSRCYNSHQEEYRSAFKFAIPVPSNGILTNVSIKASGNAGEIVGLPVDIYSYAYPGFFAEIGNSSSIFNYNQSSGTTWHNITSYASQYLSSGYFCVGARSQGSPGYVSIQCLFEWIIPAHLTFQNNMGGQLSVNGSNYTGSYSNDYWFNTNISLSVNEPQTASGYTWVWNDTEAPLNPSTWDKIKNGNTYFKSYGQSYSFSVTADDHNSTYQANMRKICNITFQNYLVGLSNYGTLTINGQSYNSPTSQFPVVEQNAINVSANTYYYNNYIEYNFSQWNDGNTSSTRTFYPNATTTYTANYIGKPTNIGKYAGAGGIVGQPIVVTWTDNPNTAVNQFQIWRKVKHNGVTGNPVLLTTIGRGVQTYTDYDYLATNGYTDDLLWYDVRAYYSIEGTYSDPDYVAAFGRISANIDQSLSVKQTQANEVPTEYSIMNYPNPFNPTTTINYQLPQDGFVTIKVYDMLGKEAAVLVNENKSAGYYRVNFDASKLTSGVYIYTITTNNPSAGSGRGFVQSKKMLLMK